MAEFFYQVMGKTIGPITAKQLRRLALDGHVDHATLVRPGNRDRWDEADRIVNLFDPETEVERAEREAERGRRQATPERHAAQQRLHGGHPGDSASLTDVLARHVDLSVGINYRNAETIETATLLTVSPDHLTVRGDDTGLMYHFPSLKQRVAECRRVAFSPRKNTAS